MASLPSCGLQRTQSAAFVSRVITIVGCQPPYDAAPPLLAARAAGAAPLPAFPGGVEPCPGSCCAEGEALWPRCGLPPSAPPFALAHTNALRSCEHETSWLLRGAQSRPDTG